MTNSPSIGQAITFMERHLKTPVAIEDIARCSGFSKSTLQRRFLEVTNVTVALFLRRLRLNAAASELVSTKRRILDIALDYQFESQQTFTRAFKQATWLTPGEARRLKKLPDFGTFKNTLSTDSGLSSPLRMRGVMIFTNNVDALTSFYHEVAGFPILDDDPNFTQLDAGGSILVLHRGATPGDSSRPGHVEINLFAIDVEGTRKELIKRGAKVGPVGILGDLMLCKACDPDGNVLGISNRPLARTNTARKRQP